MNEKIGKPLHNWAGCCSLHKWRKDTPIKMTDPFSFDLKEEIKVDGIKLKNLSEGIDNWNVVQLLAEDQLCLREKDASFDTAS